MVQIDIEYQGILRCQATHVESGTKILTDAPKDNQGKGESFSPTDLVATALGTCMLTTMGIWAKRSNIELARATIRVQKEMISVPARRIATLTVEFHGPAAVPSHIRPQLEQVALTCPVYRSLNTDIEIPAVFTWDQ